MLCRADEDRPFTYTFDAVDLCTKYTQNLDNPIATSDSITTRIRYDMGGDCALKGDRLVMVVGTVTDRLGASAELCDRSKNCPLVFFPPLTSISHQPKEIIGDVQAKLEQNQITNMQAVDELMFAVQSRQAQKKLKKAAAAAGKKSAIPDISVEEEAKELVQVLDMVKSAANDALGKTTQQTPRVQGGSLLVHRSQSFKHSLRHSLRHSLSDPTR